MNKKVGESAVTLRALGKKIGPVAEELQPLKHLEAISAEITRIARCLSSIQDAVSLSLIAQYGSDEDRARILQYFKAQFEAFQAR